MNARPSPLAQPRPAVEVEATDPCPPAVAAAASVLLEQCAAFVRAVPQTAYIAESNAIRGGTIGKHVRHTLDHFRAALDGASGMVIDYDHRERDVPMESAPHEALSAIAELCERLSSLDESALGGSVRIRVMLSRDGAQAELGSTLARELAFATHHAVHHHAMLGAIAAELGVPIAGDFGKAPSTIRHDKVRTLLT